MLKFLVCAIILLTQIGCSTILGRKLNDMYGKPFVQNRFTNEKQIGPDFLTQVKPILDNRCVVCHACYDSPCQTNLSSPEGIDRGATSKQVYLAERLFAGSPSRIYLDGSSTAEWRDQDFYPVVNERGPEGNLNGSVLYRMLELKRNHAHLDTKILASSYDFSLNRDQECPRIEEFDSFAEKYPLWGMPYGLPQLEDKEFEVIREWLRAGAKISKLDENPYEVHIHHPLVKKWENYFNGDSHKELLMSRYIYEHIFLGSLFFPENKALGHFKLVRSRTPSGKPISVIATRRPYDEPGEKFYYRLFNDRSTISAKNFMPLGLDIRRMSRWKSLFLDKEYEVTELPTYGDISAANPFKTFSQIPVHSRYSFLLDDAEFFVMGFIKGPVCRGNMALNVIEDRFWVMFVDPSSLFLKKEDEFSGQNAEFLRLPSTESSNSFITDWLTYSRIHRKYLKLKEEHLVNKLKDYKGIGLELLWDGGGVNKNNALTVFRHGDSASVVKGFVGSTPKTAWVMGYSLFERIYYLLVAGFDVYGNAGHQLSSRLSMDFMRMEGEYNFLSMLPLESRIRERDYWYRDADDRVKEFVNWDNASTFKGFSGNYETENHKEEFLQKIKGRFNKTYKSKIDILYQDDEYALMLKNILDRHGPWVTMLPDVSFLRIRNKGGDKLFTLIRDTAYSNVASPLKEYARRLPQEDLLTITSGVVGGYPNAFFEVESSGLKGFITTLTKMKTPSDYERFKDTYSIRRSNKDFWKYSDWLHDYYRKTQSEEAGYFDYNRFENR